MSDLPLITVITPTFNVGPYIAEAIASVKAQTETRFEYLIVDDGSTDNTVEIVRNVIADDDRIRLIQNDHQGGAQARNTGIAEARGTYISFIDGDDRWRPNKLERELQTLERKGRDYGVVFSQSRLISEDGLPVGAQSPPLGEYDFDRLFIDNCPMGNGSSLFLRKSCFADAGVFDVEMQSAVDFDMWLRIARDSRSPLFWCDGEVLLDYRLRAAQKSRNLDQRMEAIDLIFERYVPGLKRLPKSQAYVYHAVTAYKANDPARIARWGSEAWNCGWRYLLGNPSGRRLIGWRLLGPLAPVYRQVNSYSLSLARWGLRLVSNRVIPKLKR